MGVWGAEAEVRDGVDDRISWEWRAGMESGSAPVPVPTFPSEALLSPSHVSGAGWFCRAIMVKMTAASNAAGTLDPQLICCSTSDKWPSEEGILG